MPLLKKARIEIYLPEIKSNRLHQTFEQELLETFGGCTVIENIQGLYLASDKKTDSDKVTLVYADTPFDFDGNFEAISKYTDELRAAALEATEEESILIVVHEIYHSI